MCVSFLLETDRSVDAEKHKFNADTLGVLVTPELLSSSRISAALLPRLVVAFSHIISHILILGADCQNVFNAPDSQELVNSYFVKSNLSLKQQEKKS